MQILQYNDIDFEDIKEKKKYILQLQRSFRTSYEYKRWVQYQHENYHLVCPFTNIDSDSGQSLIELHHHPFTLYDIIEMELDNINKDYTNQQFFSLNHIPSFIILSNIQFYHIQNLIPYVPLTKTYHEQYHKINEDILQQSKIELKDEWIINKDKMTLLLEQISREKKV